ncbi:MAG TPA: tRNA (adenosine(37)-N6)-dimethylallyltransferase MiaA [Steroidobacteraceae bacterium]|nr:tRNA (adenosine(37)-N6)-dimethylallyltransferase MiaA [Steroidobacteraceae bacterium]
MSAAAPPLLVVLTGPTGTGKSACALALVEHLSAQRPVEIVSVDSAQVYRGMDIGTAKPEAAIRERVPHHLIDIRDPAQSYSAGDFVREARSAVAAIHARGALPLLVGGTMLYLRALREGLAGLPEASPEVRRQIDALAAERGWAAVHAELSDVDPAAAARIAPQDAQRLQRALEVYRLTGVPISRWQQRTQPPQAQYRWMRYALWPSAREQLRQRLQSRFEAMLAAGLVDEVRALYARGDLTPRHASMRAVGYRQLWLHCAGELKLAQASAMAVAATAQLAKRQLTWLRREREMTLLGDTSVGIVETLAEQISAASRA